MSKSAKTKEEKDEYNASSHLEHCVRFIQLNVKFLGKIEILQKNINWFCATFLQPDLGPNFALIEMKLHSNIKKLNKKNMTAYFRKKLTSLTNIRISQTLISYFSHFHKKFKTLNLPSLGPHLHRDKVNQEERYKGIC